jgi:hypothetical protein
VKLFAIYVHCGMRRRRRDGDQMGLVTPERGEYIDRTAIGFRDKKDLWKRTAMGSAMAEQQVDGVHGGR